ncbi:MAG TPA: hypothetical protein VFQ27_04565 [Xanthobacteraceae bacterium]|nr:hypothetical protein [Xanthobacteraceae bacterium]
MTKNPIDASNHPEGSHVSGENFVNSAPILRYSFRPSLLGAPQEFALERDALLWSVGNRSGRIPYRSIRQIRLSYRPVTLQMYRFQTEIWAENAPKLAIASCSWRSMVEQERQDQAYRTFVVALHQRLARSGTRPLLRAGVPHLTYWPGVVLFAAMALILPWAVARTASADAFWSTALVALLIAVFLWQIGGFFWRNRPAAYTAEAIPEAVLPRG